MVSLVPSLQWKLMQVYLENGCYNTDGGIVVIIKSSSHISYCTFTTRHRQQRHYVFWLSIRPIRLSVRLLGQTLSPRYLTDSLSNLDETY